MVIYVDVLIFINFIIDYILLKLTSIILQACCKTWRMIVGSLVASLFSLYIFLPAQNTYIDLIFRLICSLVTVLISFGYRNVKYFIRNVALFYILTFLFAGIIYFTQMIKPNSNINLNNGVVYFNISPVILITLSFVIYIVVLIIKKISAKTAPLAQRYDIILKFDNRSVSVTAMVDTGHTLKDIYNDNLMIIIDKKTASKLFLNENVDSMLDLIPPNSEILKNRFQLFPINTVSGNKILPGIRIDNIEIIKLKSNYASPIAVITTDNLGDDFSAIIPIV